MLQLFLCDDTVHAGAKISKLPSRLLYSAIFDAPRATTCSGLRLCAFFMCVHTFQRDSASISARAHACFHIFYRQCRHVLLRQGCADPLCVWIPYRGADPPSAVIRVRGLLCSGKPCSAVHDLQHVCFVQHVGADSCRAFVVFTLTAGVLCPQIWQCYDDFLNLVDCNTACYGSSCASACNSSCCSVFHCVSSHARVCDVLFTLLMMCSWCRPVSRSCLGV